MLYGYRWVQITQFWHCIISDRMPLKSQQLYMASDLRLDLKDLRLNLRLAHNDLRLAPKDLRLA